MAKLPQYQRQVGPGNYRGPTMLQVQQTFEGMSGGEAAATAIGEGLTTAVKAGMTWAQKVIDLRNKAKDAYDTAQLNKAEKTYWSMMNNAVEIDIPNSGRPITDWDEMYDEADKKAMAAAAKLIEDSTQPLKYGGPQQKTVADDLEAFQLNYNTQFRVNLYNKQGKALLDQAGAVMASDLVQLKTSPEYLEVALQHIDNYVANFPGFSKEAGEKAKEAARSVARLAGHYQNFDKLAVELGSVDQAYAWYTNPANTPDMTDTERDRFLETMSRHVNSIHAIAENNLNMRVDKQFIDYIEMYYKPEAGQWLTKQMVKDAFAPLRDNNAKNATEESNDKERQLLSMIDARDRALAAGKDDPASKRNEQMIGEIAWAIYNRKRIVLGKDGQTWVRTKDPASKEWLEKLIYDNIGRGIDREGLNFLQGELKENMPNEELKAAEDTLESAFKSGLITYDDLTEAKTILQNSEIEYRTRVQELGAENVKPLDPKWYGKIVQNFLDNAIMKTKDTKRASAEAAAYYEEARQTNWFNKRGRSRGTRDLDAFVELSERGNLAGLSRTAEWSPIFDAAEAEVGNMLIGEILGKEVTTASYVATGRPGVGVFDYTDPETGKNVEVHVYRFGNGKMVYSTPVTEEMKVQMGDKIVPFIYQKELFLSPTHNENIDKTGFALYDPASDTYIRDKDGNPILYDFPMAPKPVPIVPTSPGMPPNSGEKPSLAVPGQEAPFFIEQGSNLYRTKP